MVSITCYEVVWKLYQTRLPEEKVEAIVVQAAKIVDRKRATIYRWIAEIKKSGIRQFLWDKKTCKHRRPKARTPEYLCQAIVDIRQSLGYCGEKIRKELEENWWKWQLETKPKVPAVSTIYDILHERLDKKSTYGVGIKKYHKYRAIITANAPRELIEHDTVDLGGKEKYRAINQQGIIVEKYRDVGLYAYTSIDVFTKEPTVILATNLKDETGAMVFKEQRAIYDQRSQLASWSSLNIHGVSTHQSDGGSEFKEDFQDAVRSTGSNYRCSRPYKKNEQAHIENFNKALRSECFPSASYNPKDIQLLQERANQFVKFYINERWHMGLPNLMTPKQWHEYYRQDPSRAIIALTAWQQRRKRKSHF